MLVVVLVLGFVIFEEEDENEDEDEDELRARFDKAFLIGSISPKMNSLTNSRWLPVVLLICSNVFMTFAWYGHLKYKEKPILFVILTSWGIAFFEYLLQVPANRWGSNVYSPAQLKVIQEVITLLVFCGFAVVYLKEQIRWNYVAAFACVLAAVAFAFIPQK